MKVTVDILFAKNDRIGSRLICKFTDHLRKYIKRQRVPSHVALLVNGRWVHESTKDCGVRVISLKKWQKQYTEIARCRYTDCCQYDTIKSLYKYIRGKKYDWPGVIYLGYRVLLNRWFNCPIPKTNKYNREDRFFCSEVIGKLRSVDYSMATPVDIMSKTSYR